MNRELSWLSFNRRVLDEARDSRNPLLERVRFLEIFLTNLDEFFMKRVGGLKRQVMAHVSMSGPSRLSPTEQLREIRKAVLPLLDEYAAIFRDSLMPELESKGLRFVRYDDLRPDELEFALDFFRKSVFPVLTPLAVDPGHPFPFLSNLSTSFGILMRDPERDNEELFARVKLPALYPSWICLPSKEENGGVRFLSMAELVCKNLHSLFPGMVVHDTMMFRVTRNADIERDEEDAEDLLEMVAEELRERRFAKVVRLEHGPESSTRILSILKEELQITDGDIYQFPLPLDYAFIDPLPDLDLPSLKYDPWLPVTPAQLEDGDSNILDVIRNGDLLVHHPFESFNTSVERFVRTAVEDPRVIAIKMTLYRTGEGSPFIPLLIRAAEKGKQVVCLVELKARFDEERNILVARALEKAGVHVVYGIVGLKTHTKVTLVVRQELDGVRSYAHIGTGNYHSKTARLYTDLGLLTAKHEFTEDVVHLFHYLTGRSLKWRFRKLLVAPIEMRDSFLRMIERESRHAEEGRPARIIAKMNSLEDEQICRALYSASSKGVKVELIVRGFCCLVPGVEGLSENIRVISIIGRYLEHSRIFYFQNGAEDPVNGEFFLGSADWMHRNLDQRVECVVGIEDRLLREKCWEILSIQLNDRRQGWELQPDGEYRRRGGEDVPNSEGTHELLMKLTRERHRHAGVQPGRSSLGSV